MIKAEVITHEGNPTPNWLDQCRTMISPGRSTIAVLVIGLAVLITLVVRDSRNTPVTDVSQQATPASSLTVEPLSNPNATTTTAELNLQSPGKTSATGAVEQSSSDANSLGAQSTPALNNSKTPATTKQQPQPVNQSQLNNRSLTNTVQSTVQGLDQSVQNTVETVNNLTKSLTGGLLGL